MADVKFKIKGKVYDTASVDEISLRDIVLFNSQAADIGLAVTWNDVERISTETAEALDAATAAGLTAEDVQPHPDAIIMFAVTVWAARRIAGDDVTLGEALDVRMKDIEFVEARKAPKDRLSKSKKKPHSQLTGVPGTSDTSPPSESDETTPQTSSSKSESA